MRKLMEGLSLVLVSQSRGPGGGIALSCISTERSSPPCPSGKEASLVLGTAGTPLWLLRSRPDQVHGTCMRGGPPRSILSAELDQLAVGRNQHSAHGLFRVYRTDDVAITLDLTRISGPLARGDAPLEIDHPAGIVDFNQTVDPQQLAAGVDQLQLGVAWTGEKSHKMRCCENCTCRFENARHLDRIEVEAPPDRIAIDVLQPLERCSLLEHRMPCAAQADRNVAQDHSWCAGRALLRQELAHLAHVAHGRRLANSSR